MLVALFLAECTTLGPAPKSTHPVTVTRVNGPTPTSTQTSVPTAVRKSSPFSTDTPTPDPCTGWWCPVTGVVYANHAESGNELDGTSVTLHHFSNCSPTSGEYQTITGLNGTFEFGDVFFHDTDRIRIHVESEGHEPTDWDSVGRYCFFCNCFGSPVEIVLHTAPGR